MNWKDYTQTDIEEIKQIAEDMVLCRNQELIENGLHIIIRKAENIIERLDDLKEDK